MKTIKMSLANIEGKLSRKEMKNIMAGSGINGSCEVHCPANGQIYHVSSCQTAHIYCSNGQAYCYCPR